MPRKKPAHCAATTKKTPSLAQLKIMEMANVHARNDGESEVLSVRIPRILKERILKEAQQTGVDVSDLVRPPLGNAFGLKSTDVVVEPNSGRGVVREKVAASPQQCTVEGCWVGPVFWTVESEKV